MQLPSVVRGGCDAAVDPKPRQQSRRLIVDLGHGHEVLSYLHHGYDVVASQAPPGLAAYLATGQLQVAADPCAALPSAPLYLRFPLHAPGPITQCLEALPCRPFYVSSASCSPDLIAELGRLGFENFKAPAGLIFRIDY